MRKPYIDTYEDEDKRKDSQGAFKIMLVIAIIFGVALFLSTLGFPSELKASYYSIASLKKEGTYKHSKGIMANGKLFKDDAMTCATRLYPLGAHLLITNTANGKSVAVVVTDRISKRLGTTRIDLSRGAFMKIASLKEGLVNIDVKRINVEVR